MPKYSYVTPPARDVLCIAEIVSPICAILGNEDNYRLAQTCSSLAYPAVDELWKVQHTLSNLLNLLPQDALCWVSKSTSSPKLVRSGLHDFPIYKEADKAHSQKITRIIRPDEWERFDIYSHRVRVLQCRSLPQLSLRSTQNLAHSVILRKAPLLPGLQRLLISSPLRTPEEVLLAQLLVSPTITALGFRFPTGLPSSKKKLRALQGAAARLCRVIRQEAHSLQSLHLRLPTPSFIHEHLEFVLSETPSLQTVKLGGACESVLILNALSRLPNLRHLSLQEWKMARLDRNIEADGLPTITASSFPALETITAEDTVAWTIVSSTRNNGRPRIYTQVPPSTDHAYPDMECFSRITGPFGFALSLTSIDLYGPNGQWGRHDVFPEEMVPAVITPLLGCTSLVFLRVRGFGVTRDLENLRVAKWPSLEVLIWRTGTGVTHSGVELSTLRTLSTASRSLTQLDLPVIMPIAGRETPSFTAMGRLNKLKKLCISQWLLCPALHDVEVVVDLVDSLGPGRSTGDWLCGVFRHEGQLWEHLYPLWMDIMAELDSRRGLSTEITFESVLDCSDTVWD